MTQPALPGSPYWLGNPMLGAAHGRPQQRPKGLPAQRWYLRRVRINSGGYDEGGAYWGIGEPLWYAASESGEATMFFRARDRVEARAYVVAAFPGATFWR
jgi:hypothetical protein